MRTALEAGKPVVTANKELLAHPTAWRCVPLAKRAGVDLLYEAAVAGAIPLVRALRESLAGERIHRVMGIVNGTTNFILTRMTEEGADYADALAEAQASGWPSATRPPTSRGTTPPPRRPSWPAWPSAATWSAPTSCARGSPASGAVDIAFADRLGYVGQAAGHRGADRRGRAVGPGPPGHGAQRPTPWPGCAARSTPCSSRARPPAS